MTRPVTRFALPLALVCSALLIGFVQLNTVRERPFLAIAQPVQMVPPGPGAEDMSVMALHDIDSNTLCVYIPRTVLGGKAKLCGPAKPGANGSLIEEKPWTTGKVEYGPLNPIQRKALRDGLLYLEFTGSSPTLFPSRRGQLLPLKGIKYVTPIP